MTEFKKVNGQTVNVNLDNVLYAKFGINSFALYFKSDNIVEIDILEKDKLDGFEGNDSTLYNSKNVETIQSSNDSVRFVNGQTLVIKTEKTATATTVKRTKQAKKTT